MNHPAIVEERDSKRDLMSERFNRPTDCGRIIVVHCGKLRPHDFERQYVMFSVWVMYFKMIQGSEDVIGSGMCPWLGYENTVNLVLVALAGTIGYDELESHVSATRRGDR